MNAITVENLSKSYLVGHNTAQTERYTALRDVLARNARNLARKTRDMFQGRAIVQGDQVEEFWALKDVSFEVKRGETLGIIGRNGAGKSTLLKVLSRITEPTKGRITIRGRVASLLEVGTGFHPELTGRENIFLNGAILGMTRAEIRRRFDEIVAFAEVERFLDTPVKRYSSGMYVRLAFAVAAHLEPEILVVDEVLAVGDAAFQKKCLSKMGQISNDGRTVLFVSHNVAAIRNLCSRCLVLRKGSQAFDGDVATAIFHYSEAATKQDLARSAAQGTSIIHIALQNINGGTITALSPLNFLLAFQCQHNLPKCYLNFVIEDSEGRAVVHKRTDEAGIFPAFGPGKHNVILSIEKTWLRSGIYSAWFRLYCNSDSTYALLDSDRTMLVIVGEDVGGIVNVPCEWKIDLDLISAAAP